MRASFFVWRMEEGSGHLKRQPCARVGVCCAGGMQDDETPMFKVILLADPDYEQAHVVTQITKVPPASPLGRLVLLDLGVTFPGPIWWMLFLAEHECVRALRVLAGIDIRKGGEGVGGATQRQRCMATDGIAVGCFCLCCGHNLPLNLVVLG